MEFSHLPNTEQLLLNALVILRTKANQFTEADAISGDGDLGVNVEIVCDAIKAQIATAMGISTWRAWGGFLANVINEAAPSSFLTLISKTLKEASQHWPESEQLTRREFTESMIFARMAMMKYGKVEVGDKTVFDVLSPVVDYTIAHDEAIATEEFLANLVNIADQGLQSTVPLPAKKGRSRWNSQATIGHPDAGAMVMKELIESLYVALKEYNHEHD